MIIMCTNNNNNNNNNAVINSNLWKTPRPYFALQNSHGQAKGFLRRLWTILTLALKKFLQPCTRSYTVCSWLSMSFP